MAGRVVVEIVVAEGPALVVDALGSSVAGGVATTERAWPVADGAVVVAQKAVRSQFELGTVEVEESVVVVSAVVEVSTSVDEEGPWPIGNRSAAGGRPHVEPTYGQDDCNDGDSTIAAETAHFNPTLTPYETAFRQTLATRCCFR